MLNCSAPVKCSIPVIVNSLLRNAPKITDRLDDNKMARKYYPGLFMKKGTFGIARNSLRDTLEL
jgi:hypothetical protein